MRVRFKFHERASDQERRDVIDSLDAGAERLFPRDDDPELAAMYVTELPDDEQAAAALASLRKAEAVEFAEPEPPRGLPWRG
jgi:hypothetical protein